MYQQRTPHTRGDDPPSAVGVGSVRPSAARSGNDWHTSPVARARAESWRLVDPRNRESWTMVPFGRRNPRLGDAVRENPARERRTPSSPDGAPQRWHDPSVGRPRRGGSVRLSHGAPAFVRDRAESWRLVAPRNRESWVTVGCGDRCWGLGTGNTRCPLTIACPTTPDRADHHPRIGQDSPARERSPIPTTAVHAPST
jgi:hypothetical protein